VSTTTLGLARESKRAPNGFETKESSFGTPEGLGSSKALGLAHLGGFWGEERDMALKKRMYLHRKGKNRSHAHPLSECYQIFSWFTITLSCQTPTLRGTRGGIPGLHLRAIHISSQNIQNARLRTVWLPDLSCPALWGRFPSPSGTMYDFPFFHALFFDAGSTPGFSSHLPHVSPS
jgi:hypothetical protein